MKPYGQIFHCDLFTTLTSTAPELTKPELNSSLRVYLEMLKQHDRSMSKAPGDAEVQEDTHLRSK